MPYTGVLGSLIASIRSIVRDLNKDIVGTATSTSSGKLIDSNATFVSDGVAIGDTIYNITDTTSATVVTVDSEIQLTLSGNIFISGESYRKVGQANRELLWQDSEWLEYLIDAENVVAERALILEDSTTTAICEIDLVTGTASYDHHASIIDIENIRFQANTSLILTAKENRKTEKWLDENVLNWRTLVSGNPKYYMVKPQNKLIFIPAVSSTYNATHAYLTVKRRPSVVLSAAKTTPEIDSKYYEAMKLWALFRAYSKNDSQTFNEKAALMYLSLFDKKVGPEININFERIAKEEPEGLRIGIYR